jgi:acyl-coenzyme A synthetase/AMP-(fatty) acid ligase
MSEKARSGGWRTVPDIVVACARHRPDTPLLMDVDGRVVTAARLAELSRRGAYLLARHGVQRGQLVGLDTVAMGWVDVAIGYFAVTWLGAAAVLTAGAAMERRALDDIGVTAFVTTDGRARDGVPTLSPDDFAAASGLAGEPAAAPEDLLDLVFTSGTTGEPKPVASTHAQWVRSVRPEMVARSGRRLVAHTGIPVFVSGGLHGVLLNHAARGVSSLAARDVAELLRAARAWEVSELHVTPHAARGLVRAMDGGPQPWARRIRVIRAIGGPVTASLAEDLTTCFPHARLVSLYALTEGGSALLVKLMNRRDQDSVGRPAPGTEVRVLDAEGREVPAGEVGEVAVRAVGAGALTYFGDDALNEQWFVDGWTRTGDMGFVAEDGEVRLVGRAKELIFLRGGRVGPETVERILAQHLPAGVEFVVAGVGGPAGWDRIALFLGGDAADPAIVAAQQRLAGMKGPFRPSVVRVLETIPRGPFGKPLRRLLVAGLATQE